MKAKYKVRLKRIWNYISTFILAIGCFFASYGAFQNSSINLNDLTKITAPVLESGLTNSNTIVSGKYNLNSKVYYFHLLGSQEQFGIYRPSQKYTDLQAAIFPNKEITVYFKDDNINDKLNLQTFRIESNGQVIMNSNDYQGRERIVGWLGIAGGILLCFLAIRHDRKYWRKNTTANKT